MLEGKIDLRYSVRYQCNNKNWVVTDSAANEEIVGTHQTKASAYRHAYAEQERWQKIEPVTSYPEKIREILPQSLVVR